MSNFKLNSLLPEGRAGRLDLRVSSVALTRARLRLTFLIYSPEESRATI
jgi:hypothetical protein